MATCRAELRADRDSWNTFLDTLPTREFEVADAVLRQASELNAAEIRRLRRVPRTTVIVLRDR